LLYWCSFLLTFREEAQNGKAQKKACREESSPQEKEKGYKEEKESQEEKEEIVIANLQCKKPERFPLGFFCS